MKLFLPAHLMDKQSDTFHSYLVWIKYRASIQLEFLHTSISQIDKIGDF